MSQYYYNKNHAQHDQLRSGPYVFRNGLIKTDDASDSTVGPILVTFYGCRKVSDVEALAVLEKYNSKALETEGVLIQAKIESDKAKTVEEAKKAKADAVDDAAKAEALKAADDAAKAEALKAADDAAKAEALKAAADEKLEADKKAKEKADAKAKADATKPEDKM